MRQKRGVPACKSQRDAKTDAAHTTGSLKVIALKQWSVSMQTRYDVYEPDESGQLTRTREVLGTVFFRNERWELETKHSTIAGTLEGDPLTRHVFTDAEGREYRIHD